jgi:transcriptional regulator with XRE-family HTH domain
MAEGTVPRQSGVKVPGLRDARLRMLWKQEELAEKAGVGRSTVIRGERGGAISIENARALADVLDVSPEELLRGLGHSRAEGHSVTE